MWAWKATLTENGVRKVSHKRGYKTKTAALKAPGGARRPATRGINVEPSKMLFGAYLATRLDGLRHAASTVASYRKNVRLHIAPTWAAFRWPA